MRRGHTGIGGWRNENQRHFRPRIGGNQHFRPPRGYGLFETPRYPPPNSRSIRPHFNTRLEKSDPTPDNLDRQRYRDNYGHSARPHHGGRPYAPLLQRPRQSTDSHRNTYKEPIHYYKDQRNDHFHINSMGDVDHRQIHHRRDVYKPPQWQEDKNPNTSKLHNTYRPDRGEVHKSSTTPLEYTGHRPPASDHYGCNPVSVIDNSHAFSRSVDDTVDLIRKRLLNRSEPQNTTDNFESCHNDPIADNTKKDEVDYSRNNRIEQPSRKKYYKQHYTDNTNCAKIKNKIVHQLFKMDKEKIHKLMDNPNSSTKFEYAISSLITESQNSFNRHLRSAAEKSLCSSSTEFMQNDNNTIYEDTFMKQMQCILDPQDTVFLEDIKPIVMAELSKVLQLNEYEQAYDTVGDDSNPYDRCEEQQSYKQYPNDSYTHETFPPDNIYSEENNMSQEDYTPSKSIDDNINKYEEYQNNQMCYEEPKPLFERRQRVKSFSFNESNNISENLFYPRNVGDEPSELIKSEVTQDLFDANAEQFSEDEDPFAELDKQYHVAVDHDFIECDDISSQLSKDVCNDNRIIHLETDFSSTLPTEPVKQESETQIQNTVQMAASKVTINDQIPKDVKLHCKQESFISQNILSLEAKNVDKSNSNKDQQNESESKSKEMIKENEKMDASTKLPMSTLSNSRKRSSDQRPSHRKEKRKKGELCTSESSKQILNKNIIINVNDCASNTSDKCEVPKSIFNLFFSKEESKETLKDNKKVPLNDRNFTEKHVKRREISKKGDIKDKKTKRKNSTSTNQPTIPLNNNISVHAATIKPDTKITLKPIDMFVEQPRKAVIHQAHRNTALTPDSPTKIVPLEKKTKSKEPVSQLVTKKHVAVQVIRKLHSKETQTSDDICCGPLCQRKQIKTSVKSIQTELNIPEKSGNTSIDAFERMKEIDLEIQVLLQEKFKLYNSIESKDSRTNSMQTLGMTVLNVNPYNSVEDENETSEEILSEDTIVNDFANIPVEELEQIAFESVQEGTPLSEKPIRRRKVSYNQAAQSESPVTVTRRKNVKPKSPNISLIEQIIIDDRPIEDIISLDDLEVPVKKTRNRNQKGKKTIKPKQICRKRCIKPTTNYIIKECSVVLVRTDISPYINIPQTEENMSLAEPSTHLIQKEMPIDTNLDVLYHGSDSIVEESVGNDIQLDMLDVSEDIIVGESCEVKFVEDKEEIVEHVAVPVSEEIILDNSQSSMEDVAVPALSQNDECKMYDYSADENLRRDSIIVNGNADAVLAIECIENNFLAACLDGNVYYFNSEGQLITTLRGSNLAVTCLTIVKEKYGTTVYTGSLDSRIRYYDLETGIEKGPECNVLSPIQTMDRAWDTVFVGTRTGFVLQFECKNNMLIPVSSVKFSDQSILALRAMKEGPRKVLLVAARSENVTIKDAQTGLLLRTLEGPKMTVYTLLYEDGKIYCGTSSNQIHVFDYTSGSHVGTHEGGKGAVCLRATGGLLFAGCYDGCVYVYREGEGQPFAQIRGPSLMLLSLAVVGSKIIAGYKDRSLYIWKIPLSILQEMIL